MRFIFLEIGADKDYVHFLLQSIPAKRSRGHEVKRLRSIVEMLKIIITREIFKRDSEIRKFFMEGVFWSSGYVVN